MKKLLDLKETGKILLDAKRIAMAIHMSPDGDAIGSSLALARVLRAYGKEVTIFVDDIIKGFKFLPEIKTIKTETDLDGITEPLHFDLLCILDCSTMNRIGRVKEKVLADKYLNIDHHISNEGFVDFTYLDGHAAATAEIISQLVKEMRWDLDKQAADYLFTGIYTDSGSFAFSCTRPETMYAGADLMKAGAEPHKIDEAMDVMDKDTLWLLTKALNTMTFDLDGRLAYMWVDRETYAAKQKSADTDSFVTYPRRIEGVEVAVFFKEVEENITRLSMRSKKIDISKIALLFNGGGHERAAGCTIHKPLQEAIGDFLGVIKDKIDKDNE